MIGVRGQAIIEWKPFTLTWFGKPGDAKVNHRFIPAVRGKQAVLVKSKKYRDAVRSMQTEFLAQATRKGAWCPGPLRVTVCVRVHRKHRAGPAEGLAYIDVDACCKAVLDALQHGDVIADEAQVRELRICKEVAPTKDVEGIWVEVAP